MQDYFEEVQIHSLKKESLSTQPLFTQLLFGIFVTLPVLFLFDWLADREMLFFDVTAIFTIIIIFITLKMGHFAGAISCILALFHTLYLFFLSGSYDPYQYLHRFHLLSNCLLLVFAFVLSCLFYNKQKRDFSQLKQSERLYRNVFFHGKEPAFLFTLDENALPNKYLDVNNTALKMMGYDHKEFLGKPASEINNELNLEPVRAFFETLIQEGSSSFDTVYINKTGERFPIRVHSDVFHIDQTRMIISTVQDMGMIKRAELLEQDMDEKKRQLEETLKNTQLRTEFLSNISHELRTPINLIFSTIHLFSLFCHEENGEKNFKDVKKYINIMKQNCYRLLRLINNIIDISKLDSGFLEIKLQNLDIVNLVENITLSVTEYVEQKELTLIFDTDQEEKVLACDPDKIERIMLNLLSNAVKFTPKGGTIEVKLQCSEEWVQIMVTDTGIGIPADKIHTLFRRFEQVHHVLEIKHQGSGIGLSLVKSFVELHQGSVRVESLAGVGSSFIIDLPVILLEGQAAPTLHRDARNDHIEQINVEFSDIYS